MANSPVFIVPETAAPVVSVLMVTYNAREWVARAIDALVRNTPEPYELTVVDNDSTDGTREFLRASLRGARVIELPENIGFGPGNNRAAIGARAPLLAFLNTDALVPPGWVTALARNFDDPSVGAVVPVYTYPDGRLQEAGAIVESDGRVVPLGVDDDPDDERWSFSRIVPYGSAACMLVRRSAFEEIGGFDPVWGLAYYEDVDLAFSLRERGLSVRLDASVRVVHAQGASSPSSEAARALRDANQERFAHRWHAWLWHRPTLLGATQAHRFVAARDCEAVDRVLIIAGATPADRAAAVPLGRALAGALAEGQVTVAFPDGCAGTAGEADARLEGVEIVAPSIWEGWLAGRRFQFAAVVADPAEQARNAGILADTQPQAATTAPPRRPTLDDPGALGAWLLELGLVPRAAARR